jgi:cytidylate kinase
MAVAYYPLINKFVKFFQVRESLASSSDTSQGDQQFKIPFITIAREPGSGGAPIAAAVAKKLGFQLVDEKLLEDIAKSTKMRKELIKAVDEKQRTIVEDMVQSLLNPDYVDDIKYVKELTKAIIASALKGKAVIVGRGSNFLTPLAKGLHVNITAPYEVRVKRAMQYEGFNRKKAEQVIAKVEKERKAFVKQYLDKDLSRMNSYDMTLNTMHFSVEQARDAIIDMFGHKFPSAQSRFPFLKH